MAAEDRFVVTETGGEFVDAEGKPLPEPEDTESAEIHAGKGEEGGEAGESEGEGTEAGEAEEEVITFGDEDSSEDEGQGEAAGDSSVIRHLRKTHKEAQRRNRELEARLAELEAKQAPVGTDPGPIPTLEQHDYDDEAHAAAVEQWTKRKLQAEAAKTQATQQEQQRAQQLQTKASAYVQARESTKIPGYTEAESTVDSVLNEQQKTLLLENVESGEKLVQLVAGLSRSPQKLAQLAAITDDRAFAYAVGRLEGQVKVAKRTIKAKPETRVSGTARISSVTDSVEARLEKDAAESGDLTKLYQYQRAKASKQG